MPKNMGIIKMSLWNEKEAKRLFQILPFYNVLIEKPKIKGLKNIDLLHELPFYDELNIYETLKSFGWYIRSYKVEIVDSKDLLAQSQARKPSIKDLLKDLLDEIKGFKYQITVKASLIKHKGNGDTESADICFNSNIKTVINFKYIIDKFVQEILYRIDN